MRDHKSLEAWKAAHEVVIAALDFGKAHWHPSLRAIYDQLTAAALSVQLNIAEGYGLGTKPQFLRHLRIAYGSALEVGDLIEVLADHEAIPKGLAGKALMDCGRSQRLLLGLMRRYRRE